VSHPIQSIPDRLRALITRLEEQAGGSHQALTTAAAHSATPHHPPAPQTLLWHSVHGTLIWEASSAQARLSHQHLLEHFADYNDLRVAPTAQIISCIGERSPLVTERSLRLKAWLGDLFRRTHAMDLEFLRNISRGDAKAFLLSLDGMPASGAAYVASGLLGDHSIPVDMRLLALFVEEQVFTTQTTLAQAAAAIESSFPPDQLPKVLRLLRWWSDHHGQAPKRESFDLFKPQPIAPLEVATEESARKRAPRRRSELKLESRGRGSRGSGSAALSVGDDVEAAAQVKKSPRTTQPPPSLDDATRAAEEATKPETDATPEPSDGARRKQTKKPS